MFGLILAAAVMLTGSGRLYDARRAYAKRASTPGAPIRRSVLSRSMVLLLIAMVGWGLAQYGFLGLFVTFLRQQQHFTLGAAATVASVAGWTAFAFSVLGGWLSDHIGRRNAMLIFGSVTAATAYPVFALSGSFWPALVLGAVFQAASGMYFPLGVSYGQDLAQAEHLGVHTGSVTGVGHVLSGVAGLVAGSIASVAGFGGVGWEFLGAGLLMVVCIYFTVEPGRERRQRPTPVPAAAAA